MERSIRRTNSSVIDHGNHVTKPRKCPAEDLLESMMLKKHASSAPPTASPSSQPLGANTLIASIHPSLNVANTLPLAGSSVQASNPAITVTQGTVQSPMSSLEDHIPIQRGVKLGSQRPCINMAQREADVAAENKGVETRREEGRTYTIAESYSRKDDFIGKSSQHNWMHVWPLPSHFTPRSRFRWNGPNISQILTIFSPESEDMKFPLFDEISLKSF